MNGKRLLVILLIFPLLFSSLPAHAEFSPRYTAWMEKDSIELEAGITFSVLSPLTETSLATMNDWLSRIRFRISGEENAARRLTRGQITLDGTEIFCAAIQEQAAYTLTTFSPSGNAYLTGPGEKDALTLLSGEGMVLPELTMLSDLYLSWAPVLYPLLEEMVTPKISKSSTSIKNATASSSYINYTFKADEMNAAWPQILDTLLPLMKDALGDQPDWYRTAEEILPQLVFSGECRFKRFLDKQGADMGMQFTGNAALGNDVRKVTLFGGYTPDKGGYFSLSLPATKGKNTLKFTFSGKLTQKDTQRTLALESTYSRTLDGESASFTLEGSLKNAIKTDKETWSGKITLTEKTGGVSSVWTLTPALTFTDDGLQGEMALQQKQNKTTLLKAAVALSLRQGQPLDPPMPESAQDLRSLQEANARALVLPEMVPLTRALMLLIVQLPEETRNLLTHEMRTDAWMNGPTPTLIPAPAIPESLPEEEEDPLDYSQWIVTDDSWTDGSAALPAEEENP
ncbi:MAG: hypothetical protein E7324_02785 [Clostridiales bacterium]|nr:hypothetical protein [Clostridiales bacterium]